MALDVVANNVANAPTPAFHADAVAFRETPAADPRGGGMPPQLSDLRFASVDAVVQSWVPGPLVETGNAFDVAIEGDGLLTVRAPQGMRFSRGGTLSVDRGGTLVTAEGYPLLNLEGQPVRPGAGVEPVIGEDGSVYVDDQPVGRLALRWVDNTAALSREGENLYALAGGVQTQAAEGHLQQGYIERSNVNVVKGMVDLVSITRSYEATVRVLESFRAIDRRTAKDLAHG
jgi:flagellar basal-body rod protein FlgG